MLSLSGFPFCDSPNSKDPWFYISNHKISNKTHQIPKLKLEQLERLRSNDTPHRLMTTHTIESYRIPSQNENIGQGLRSLHVTHPLMLMMICAKYGKNASRIVDFFQCESRKIRKISEKIEILKFS